MNEWAIMPAQTLDPEGRVTCLEAAHELVNRLRPAGGRPRELCDYYWRAARLYYRLADLDPAHEHEALSWGWEKREMAELLERAITEERARHDVPAALATYGT